MAGILIADTIAEAGLRMLSEQHDVTVATGLSEDELIEALAGRSALVVRSQTQVTARVIESASQLEVIGRAGVGVDNIDLDAATQNGVIVANAPLANTLSAAEHAMALMLALARNIPQGDASLRAGEWKRAELMGVELAGRTLGIVGLGRIGSEVARRARAFEMQVVAYDPFVSEDRAGQLGVQLLSFDELLATSDFVSLHTALYEGNHGMLGVDQLAKVKPGIRIINTARGALIDEQALYDAVESGRVAGAAIDVFSEEPANGNILTTHPNILVTPHLAASTVEAQDRAAVQVAEQVLAVLSGGTARFAVNAPLVDPETMAVIGPYIDAAELAACVATQLAEGGVQKLRIEYLGEIANHETALIRAGVIVGMLERVSTAKVTIVNAEQLAEERGLRIEEETGPAPPPYANLVVVHAVTESGEIRVAATHTPSGRRIVGIGDFEVEIAATTNHLLAIENIDLPGMIGAVGQVLGRFGRNISSMSVAAGPEGTALMALSVDGALTAEQLAEIMAIDQIHRVRQVDLT